MPPRPPSTSPAVSATEPRAPPALPRTPPAPPRTPSSWPAMGAGRRSLRKPMTVSTAERACDSLMPVFSVTCLMRSSIKPLLPLSGGRAVVESSDGRRPPRAHASDEDDGLRIRDVEAAAAALVPAHEHVVHTHHVVE